jgi:hypothetical protein
MAHPVEWETAFATLQVSVRFLHFSFIILIPNNSSLLVSHVPFIIIPVHDQFASFKSSLHADDNVGIVDVPVDLCRDGGGGDTARVVPKLFQGFAGDRDQQCRQKNKPQKGVIYFWPSF